MPTRYKLLNHFRIHAIGYLIAAGLPILLIIPLATGMLDRFDYPSHLKFTKNFTWPMHFFYHLSLRSLYHVFADWRISQQFLLLTNYAVLGLSIYFFLSYKKPLDNILPQFVALLAVILCFIYVFPALYFIDHHLYKNYFSITTYHSPTLLLLKPFAVLHLVWLNQWLNNKTEDNGTLFSIVEALLLVCSAITKPSYAVVVLPAAMILVMIYRLSLRSFLLSIFLPAVAVLFALAIATYGGDSSSSVIFAPFTVVLHNAPLWIIFPKLLLSIVFPLSLVIMFRGQLLSDRLIAFTWLMFFISVGYGWMLAESGERLFSWQLALVRNKLQCFFCLSRTRVFLST